ncbi:MAG: peptidoglycan DD-metalloendopeptidase family protein [Alphaproteobacteria bacterium]
MNKARFFILLLTVLMLPACLERTRGPAPVSAYGSTEGVGTLGVHTVEDGDTLWTISQRYDIAIRDLVMSNNLQPPYRFVRGLRLRLPRPYEYTARHGDSIYTVSRMFKTSPSELAHLNNLRAPYSLNPGQLIRLPVISAQNAAAVPGLTPTTPGEAVQVGQVTSEPLALLPGQSAAPAPISDIASAPYETASLPPQPEIVQPARKNPITAKTPKRASGKFLRPVNGRVISGYGPKEGGFHNDGINIAAPKGTPVKAAENGVVVYAGNKLKGSGNLILIRHENRWMSAYGHLDNIKVKRGDVIKYGQEIGTVGSTGSVDAPQLHFEIRRGTEALNPQTYLEG